MRWAHATLLLLTCLPSATAWAHKPSDSYLKIAQDGHQVRIQWEIALKDLEYVLGLDADANGDITWGEVKAQRLAIAAHALGHLRLDERGHSCDVQLTQLMATKHSDGGYAVLVLNGACPAAGGNLTLHYSFLFDADPTHRGLVLYANGESRSTHVLSADAPTTVLRATKAGLWRQFADFVRVGVWHILIGYDHILFLATLLMPSVLELRRGQWRPAARLRPTLTSILRIVTVFTVAHSITLWLAVMGYVTLPSRLVEASIALSIVITAANNLYPVLPFPTWAIAFLFGLVHGFGFANVLLDLGLSNASLATALFGFNVGVELGQLAIVILFLPLAFLLRDTAFYRSVVFRFGSVLIVVVGALWMVERTFNLRIMSV